MTEGKKRYAFQIAYKGTAYRGWQRQKGVVSVQQTIEEALSDVFHEKLSIWGCGRTDAGVHASKYFFHSDIQREHEENDLVNLNRRLPEDIVVLDMFRVDHNWNAQKSAVKRTYHYCLHYEKDAFKSELSAYYSLPDFDVEKTIAAVSILNNYSDFRAFCKTPEKHNHTRCSIFEAIWKQDESDGSMRFEITADRFLRGMIRILVHYLLEVGRGKMQPETFEYHLKSQERPPHLKFAHPQGLYLHDVVYTEELVSIIY